MNETIHNLLVVDDNLADYMLLEYAIKSAKPESKITWFKDGKDTSEFILNLNTLAKNNSSQVPHLIFLDINLPGMSGLEILQLIKSQPITSSVPVIIVSHSKVEEEIDKLEEHGADMFLHKEINLEIFSKQIKNILEKYG